MSTEITKSGEVKAWELAQRRAKALGASTLVPEAYRGAANIGNVLIALDIADRLGASPMLVMQNLHVIGGRPSWSASFLIATVNQCGRFSPLRFEVRGEDPTADGYRVRAVATDRDSGEVCEGEWITWKMVTGEGWDRKQGSKWKTMPGQMFRYRAAAFWTRCYAPEVSMGILTANEAEDAGPARGAATVDLRERMSALEAPTAETAPGPTETPPTAPSRPEAPSASPEVSTPPPCPVCGATQYDRDAGVDALHGCSVCQGRAPSGDLPL